MPKVSICIPTYMQVEYLRKTLDSILLQTYSNYEIIICDDSPDELVKQLVNSFDFGDKLKYYKNIKPLGSPKNWNKTIELANGEYIKMLHHDDFFSNPFSLENYVMMLDKNPDCDFAFSAAIAMNINENKTWIHSATKQQLEILRENPRQLFFSNFIGPPSSTIYRSKRNYKYDVNLKWVVDFDFYIQFLSGNKRYQFTDEPLITSICGAQHNITNECINNKSIELFEYLYLFRKQPKEFTAKKKDYILFFKNLFSKYDVNSIYEIRKAGFIGKLPFFIIQIILNRKIKNAFKKK